ncbi:vWA-MoxR associated conflict system protein [Streptomyces xanthophaeus]|uniref:vWA-MoxR associated conflict system protein n=1 Tax=Streptomyces xanthophaeus TaxID=67385 RepID=UPI00131BEADF|nr:hypothetical protein [Streptomyces xanthophaeus]
MTMSVAALPQARHVLVVATQCSLADHELRGLVEVADELHQVLTDPALGACLDAGVTGGELVRSGSADRATVDKAVREAIVRAGEARAVLVLAFLGHAQSPKGSPHLFYMAQDSEQDDETTSVDVNALIAAAANRLDIAGVIALVDTCQAGAALPTAAELVSGFRDGQTQVSVLAAAPAQEPAFDLDFSRRITHHVREGFAAAGEFVTVGHYRAALAEDLPVQDPLTMEYCGVPRTADERLWLAMNVQRRAVRVAEGLGTIGASDLSAALRSWRPQDDTDGTPYGMDQTDLTALRDRAALSPDLGAMRVREVTDALLLVRETELFLVAWAGKVLTSYAVRRAMTELNAGSLGLREPMTAAPDLSVSELLRHFLEHAALLHPGRDGRRHTSARELLRCLVTVAQVCGLDPSGEDVRKWADAHGLTLDLTDALDWARGLRQQGGASLVVSLHAARYDWPDSLTVWLRQGEKCSHAHTIACTPSREGVEKALPEVLDWAEERLPLDVRLDHVDMVVRAALLPKWRPEEAEAGLYLLGVDRSVVLRWADRLFVPGYLRSMNQQARRRLEACHHHVVSTGEAPVDWVHAASASEVDTVRRMFMTGEYQRAAGIGRRSEVFAELVQTLLPYTPVLLWPDEETGTVVRPPAALARLWERLPADFIRAQRLRWTADVKGADDMPPDWESAALAELAALRAAWHDLPWLDFCDSFQGRAPMSAGGSQ